MAASETTCWTMIEAAAKGSQREREVFARHYLSVIRSYLTARWGDSALLQLIDDAVQEVFVECFRSDGPLARADRARAGGFRPFLFGVVRNVARRFENRHIATSKARQGDVDGELSPQVTELLASLESQNRDQNLQVALEKTWQWEMDRLADQDEFQRQNIALSRQSSPKTGDATPRKDRVPGF